MPRARNCSTQAPTESAIAVYEQLEARFPYGRHAQQAQLDHRLPHIIACMRAKPRSPDCDRFIRLHPNHPNVDYAYFLKGLGLRERQERRVVLVPAAAAAVRS